jgi:hypothetical protein
MNMCFENVTRGCTFRLLSPTIFAIFDATQVKKQSYHDSHFVDQFLPVAMEIFGYLHKLANVFFT